MRGFRIATRVPTPMDSLRASAENWMENARPAGIRRGRRCGCGPRLRASFIDRGQLDPKLPADVFEHAFGDAAIGLAIVSLDGRWIQAKQALSLRHPRLRRRGDAGLTFRDITHPDDVAIDIELVRKLTRATSPRTSARSATCVATARSCGSSSPCLSCGTTTGPSST
jgi:hypothetical protein